MVKPSRSLEVDAAGAALTLEVEAGAGVTSLKLKVEAAGGAALRFDASLLNVNVCQRVLHQK